MRVALLGTGIMGSGMARNVAAAGHPVVVWNRTREKAEALAGAGIEVADTPAAAAAGADLLVTVLFDADATEAVVTGPDGAFAAEHGPGLWVQSATVGLDYEHLASLARAAGVTYLDAPVLGTKGPARAGELVTLLAGAAEARQRALPVIEAWSSKIILLGGEPGPASRMKLLVNTWLAVLDVGLAEVLTLAGQLGVPGRDFLDTLEGGALWAPYLGIKGELMIDQDFEPHFPLVGLHKDLDLSRAAGNVAPGELPVLDGVLDALQGALEAGLGDRDMAAVIEALPRPRRE